ncbi:MAG: ferritin family protein [Anaerolineae bacterium]
MNPEITAAVNALKIAIQTEREGRQFYREAARKTQDPKGREMFASLAQDELAHERILNERLEGLERQGEWQAGADQEWPAADLPSEGIPIFSRERIARDVRQYTYELSALRMAYLLERDAVTFYTRAAEETDNAVGKAMFEELAEWERNHQRILEQEYDFLGKQFELAMGFAPF